VQVEADMSESTPIYHSIFQLQNTTAPQEPSYVPLSIIRPPEGTPALGQAGADGLYAVIDPQGPSGMNLKNLKEVIQEESEDVIAGVRLGNLGAPRTPSEHAASGGGDGAGAAGTFVSTSGVAGAGAAAGTMLSSSGGSSGGLPASVLAAAADHKDATIGNEEHGAGVAAPTGEPTGMIISNILGYCSFLNGTYLRQHNLDHGGRPTYRSEEKAPESAGPAAGNFVYLFYHTKNTAWVMGLKITESSGAAAYRKGTEQIPSGAAKHTWCVSNKHGKFVGSEFTLCKPIHNGATVAAEEVARAASMSNSKATSRKEAQRMLMEVSRNSGDGGVGCFVLRDSTSVPNSAVLSVMLSGNRMEHILVQANEKGFTLNEMQFRNLRQLIEHYELNPLRVGEQGAESVTLGKCVHGSEIYLAAT